MATKKTSNKVTELAKAAGGVTLDGAVASSVVVETRLTKMELAEYLATAAQEAFVAELLAAEAAVIATKRVTLTSNDLTPEQRKALVAYRSVYGSGDVQLGVAHSGHGPRVWIGAPDRSGVVWDLPTEEIQKSHPLHEQNDRAFKAYRAIHERRNNFNPAVCKMQVIEAMLGGTESGKSILLQLKGVVNRAVRGE